MDNLSLYNQIARAALVLQFLIAGRVCFSYSHKSRYFNLFAVTFIGASTLSLGLSLTQAVSSPIGQTCSWILMAVSQLIFISALAATRQQPLTAFLSHDAPQHLLQRGPYRAIRHPLYTAYVLSFVAHFAAAPNFGTAVIALMMSGLFLWGARMEEQKFAQGPLAEAYAAYRQNTGALWPRWPRLDRS